MRHTLLAALLLPAQLLAGCASNAPKPVTPPQLDTQSLKTEVLSAGMTEFALVETVHVKNTGATPARVASAAWELVFDGKVIATGNSPQSQSLAPGEEADLRIESSSGAIAQSAEEVEALGKTKGGFPVALRGSLTVTGEAGASAEFAFAKATQLRAPRLPVIKMSQVSASHYDDDHIALTFRIGFENPNPFPLSIKGFTYVIDINGQKVVEQTSGGGTDVPASATKVIEVSETLTPAGFKDLVMLYKRNSMKYALKGEVDMGLAKLDVELAAPIEFTR